MANPCAGAKWQRLTAPHRAAWANANLPCAICGKPINYTLRHPNRWALTVDHRIPRWAGGPPLDPANWQPAHGVNGCPMCPPNPSRDRRRRGKPQRCNQAKGNKLGHTISPRSRHW